MGKSGRRSRGQVMRSRVNGDVADMSIEASVGARIKPLPNGCWQWLGARNTLGYGNVRVRQRVTAVHRFVYETLRGDIEEGMHLHHICGNTACVNPDHLEPLTPKEHKAAHKAS